jgi:hypothetical protein
MLRCLEVEFLGRSASCVTVPSICAAPFSNMRSTQDNNRSRILRLRCGCQFPWCALVLRERYWMTRVVVQIISLWLQRSEKKMVINNLKNPTIEANETTVRAAVHRVHANHGLQHTQVRRAGTNLPQASLFTQFTALASLLQPPRPCLV